jgi:light-regulated signal transduction histidine kinase (bacteriophytochrome)
VPDSDSPDLSICANEPIRVPGAIQPHGLLAILGRDGGLRAYSANWPDATAAQRGLDAVAAKITHLQDGDSPEALGQVQIDGRMFDATAHAKGQQVTLEFEAAGPADQFRAPIYALARHALPKLQRVTEMAELLQFAVTELKALTGFGRCLLYRFDEGGHGEVLAEAVDQGYDSYAGHHFPADDIPAQARELYLTNQIRLIPDAGYRPVPLLAAYPGVDVSAIDLSFASLRSVSPVHVEYMRNMGTLASMSVSLVVQGRLWGLISCHNHDPLHLPVQTRVACEHLGRLVAMQIAARETASDVSLRLDLRQLTLHLVAALAESDATLRDLVARPELLQLAQADGAAVVLDDGCWLVGDTPDADTVRALSAWLADSGQAVYATDRLSDAWPAAGQLQSTAAGVLALSISEVHRHQIIWFRPERVRAIRWAGEPRKPKVQSDGRIHPRLSFDGWQELVRGQSAPWSAAQLNAAHELRQALIGIVLKRAEELAKVATELARVNKELEAFSYTVSHDLRAPMRHISGYVDLVLEGASGKLSDNENRYLAHTKDAATYAARLVDGLLDFSRMGRSALKRADVDADALVASLVRDAKRLAGPRRIEWSVAPGLPHLWADPVLIETAVGNLISNAVKYTQQREDAHIEIRAVSTPAGDGLEVADNGVGFDMQYAGKLFGVFQRLHSSEAFEGTGIGLATLRRIVERHGGTVWARGEPGRGATFGFTLPRAPATT